MVRKPLIDYFPLRAPPSGTACVFALLDEADAARLAHLGLDPMLGFQLLQELAGRERNRKDIRLALHRREIAGAQLREPVQPVPDLAREPSASPSSASVTNIRSR